MSYTTTTDIEVARAAIRNGDTVVEVTATPCKFSEGCMSVALNIGRDNARDRLYLIRPKAPDVQVEADAMAARVALTHTASFYVSSRAHGRKPAGYKKLPYILARVDRDTVAAAA